MKLTRKMKTLKDLTKYKGERYDWDALKICDTSENRKDVEIFDLQLIAEEWIKELEKHEQQHEVGKDYFDDFICDECQDYYGLKNFIKHFFNLNEK